MLPYLYEQSLCCLFDERSDPEKPKDFLGSARVEKRRAGYCPAEGEEAPEKPKDFLGTARAKEALDSAHIREEER